jgi:hypothetical protein
MQSDDAAVAYPNLNISALCCQIVVRLNGDEQRPMAQSSVTRPRFARRNRAVDSSVVAADEFVSGEMPAVLTLRSADATTLQAMADGIRHVIGKATDRGGEA